MTVAAIDPILLSVLANRFEAVVREMSHTLQKAAFSPLISVSRDFSCAVVTADNQLLASAEGLPVQNYGADLQTAQMVENHPDLAPGDAFLHNDPYNGAPHVPDLGVLVPIFVAGRHVFTAIAKGHVVDSGGPTPGSEALDFADVYAEGSLVFPATRVERDYREIEDITRLVRRHVRLPDQWYGDYRAMLGAGRTAERRIADLVAKYGIELVEQAASDWLDYSERMMVTEIKKFPAGRMVAHGRLDPMPVAPAGIPLKAEVTVDPESGYIDVDLRDNIDCLPAGINASVSCTISAVMQGVFGSVDPTVPHNAGSFRRVRIHLRENCIIGIPRFPASLAMSTSVPTSRVINLVQAAFAQLGDGWGVAEGGVDLGVSYPEIHGHDPRKGEDFLTFFPVGNNGGPASAMADGWLTYTVPCVAGLLYRNSIEVDEQRYPVRFEMLRIVSSSGGHGRHRGAPTLQVGFGPTHAPMAVGSASDGYETPARGVCGGRDGNLTAGYRVDREGTWHPLPPTFSVDLLPGEHVVGYGAGGGGYGDPLDREAEAVRRDAEEGWIRFEDAQGVYGVVLVPTGLDSYEVDVETTSVLRDSRKR